MRVLHTSDWHLGKTLHQRDRIAEQAAFVDEIVRIAEDERIDLVLIAGDIFDTFNPSAAAEELFFEAIDRLADGGRRGVVAIAGNHDKPERLTASKRLAGRQGISILGLPADCPAGDDGGDRVRRVATAPSMVELAIPSANAHAVVAALPYPSEARLNELLSASLDQAALQRAYADRLRLAFARLEAYFRPDAVNLAMSHLFVRGGKESDSEIQLGDAYRVSTDDLPESAQYVALGHLHRPQKAGRNGRYSGSPLAYSFSEAGQKKSAVVVDVEPGRSATVNQVPLTSGKQLVRWKVDGGLAEVRARFDEGRDAGAWIDLEVHLERPLETADLADLRERNDGLLAIHAILPSAPKSTSVAGRSRMRPEDMFRGFYTKVHGVTPSDELVDLFLEMLAPATLDTDGEEEASAQ